MNVAGASALIAVARRTPKRMLVPFGLGCAVFAAWALVFENVVAPRLRSPTRQNQRLPIK